MDKYLTPTTVEDIDYVSPRLREADYNEYLAASGENPHDVLHKSLDLGGTSLTLRAPNGGCLGLCGVVPSHLENAGLVWMCATDDIYQYQTAFLRKSKAALDYLAGDYAVIYNCVDARNTLHIKWLKWMGFTFINKHEKYGAAELPFYEFLRINKNV